MKATTKNQKNELNKLKRKSKETRITSNNVILSLLLI